MPWFTAWPESIKKRACRYLLQHYLGQFLQEKLSLDQLNVDLYNGTGHVDNVPLDIWSLNELLDQSHVPVELVDGYIGSIIVTIPWSALLSDNCKVQIRGLEITLQPKYRNETELGNMTDSFYRSLGNMTTSMQLAEECLKGQGSESQNSETGGLFEGLEVFAQTIETVLSRVRVSLVDTVIRIEHLAENSKTGIGLEIHVDSIEYFDEKTLSEDASVDSGKTRSSSSKENKSQIYQRDSITCKRFRANGIKVLLDEFPEQMRTSPRGSVESFSSGSPTVKKSGPILISSSPDTQFLTPEKEKPKSQEEFESDGPLVIGKFFGSQELKLRIKQNDHVAVPNLDAECFLGSFSGFLTPHQVHLLIEIANGIASPSSGIPSGDVEKGFMSANSHNLSVEHGIQLSPENCERNATRYDDEFRSTDLEEDQFFSMDASKISVTSPAGQLPPTEKPDEYEPSLYSGDSMSTGYTPSLSTNYSHHRLSRAGLTQPSSKLMGGGHMSPQDQKGTYSPLAATMPYDISNPVPIRGSNKPTLQRIRTTSFGEEKSSFDSCHYQIQLSAAAITILHINPLPPSSSPSHTQDSKTEETSQSSSVPVNNKKQENLPSEKCKYLSEMSKKYFVKCSAALSDLTNCDISDIREDLAEVCCPHDHLRLVAAHIHVNSQQKSSLVSDSEVSIGRAEVTECLFSDSKSNRNSPKSRRQASPRSRDLHCNKTMHNSKSPTHSNILVFQPDPYAFDTPTNKSMYMSLYNGAAPNIKIHIACHDKHRKARTSLYVHLSACESEVDISIVDRLSTLLYPPEPQAKQPSTTTSLFSPPSLYTPLNSNFVNRQAVFNEALTEDNKEKQLDFNISATFLKINFRFPIADLRPEVERRPWYTRLLRDEILVLEAHDIAFVTSSLGGSHHSDNSPSGKQWRGNANGVSQQIQEYEITVKDLHVLYSDETDKPPKSFLRISQSTRDMEPLGGPMDANTDLDCPHIKITINPSQIENNTLLRGNNTLLGQQAAKPTEEKFDENDFGYFDDDFPMTGSHDNNSSNNPSPFSQRKVVYDSEEMVLPGDSSEIQAFCDHAVSTSQISISLSLPAVNIFLISKSFFENLYNRINNDILLWEPAAPKPHRRGKPGFDSRSVSYLSDNAIPERGLDLASQLLLNSQAVGFNLHPEPNDFSESDSDSDDTSAKYDKFPSTTRRSQKSMMDGTSASGRQSLVSVTTKIGHGRLSARCSLLDDDSSSQSQHGEIVILVENGTVFNVARYCGNPLLDYVCIQVNCCSLYHKAAIPTLRPTYCNIEKLTGDVPDHLDKVLGRGDDGILATFSSGAKIGTGPDSQNMVTVALKIETEEARPMKQCLIAACVSGATLNHTFTKTGHSWLEQLIDFIDATDDKVLGYEPPSFITEMHLNVRDSAVVYRPLHMTPSVGVVLTASSFSLSSNIVAGAPVSLLRMIIDQANLYITDKPEKSIIDLHQDYACVLDVNVFEISLKISNEKENEDMGGSTPRQHPNIDLQASNNLIRLRTCADSCALLGALIRYLADDGDLMGGENQDSDTSSTCSRNRGLQAQEPAPLSPYNPSRNKEAADIEEGYSDESDDEKLPDLMADAMEEVFEDARSDFAHPEADRASTMTGSMYSFPTSSSVPKKNNHYRSSNPMSQSVMIPNETQMRKSRNTGHYHSTRQQTHHRPASPDDDEFCIINDPGMGIAPRGEDPEIKYREASSGEPDEAPHIQIHDNHFKPNLSKIDQLRAPEHFPIPLVRYTLKEMSCVWSMYGGSDFQVQDRKRAGSGRSKDLVSPPYSPKNAKSSPIQLRYNTRKGSINYGKLSTSRDPTMLMELHLTKVRFQHEDYPKDAFEAARTVLIVSDFEVRDKLQSSNINKFLYRFHSSSSPKQAHAKSLLIKALQIRPEGPGTPPECRLRISLQPLRLNVDQDTLTFLTKFFSDITNSVSEEDGSPSHRVAPSSTYETAAGSPTGHTQSSPKNYNTPYSSPVMTRPNISQKRNSLLGTTPPSNNSSPLLQETPDLSKASSNFGSSSSLKHAGMQQPLFFRELVFSPEVPIRLDYHGKRIDTEQGTFAGLLMGLGQLNCSQLKLRRVVHRHGLLGADKLISYLLNEWAADIRANQLPLILGGVGPMHSVVQLFQGVRDLVWLPVEQYRKDGRIVRGLQRGATSFGTSTAMATLEITNRAIGLIQSAAETTYELVSPPELHRRDRRAQRNWRTLGNHAIRRQPADIREGMSNAITVVRHGVQDTAGAIVRVAQKEHERKGVTGAVGGVLRHIPPALVRPVIMATEATTNVLSGIRNQIQPDAKQQDEDKWKDMESIEIDGCL